MLIAVAQIDPVVGAFEANVGKILESYERALQKGARLLLTPELSVCGYPPNDLVERPELVEQCERALERLASATRGKSCALAVGAVLRNPLATGRAAQNVAVILENGKAVYRQAKTLLPTYDVFDEARYFEPAAEIAPWICDGKRVSVAICEDLWGHDPAFSREIYGERDPLRAYLRDKPDLLVSLSASPYVQEKRAHREALHARVARELRAPVIYVNQVGATDEVLFDGGSFAVDAAGAVTGRLPLFRPAFDVVEVIEGGGDMKWQGASGHREDVAPSELEILTRALVVGIREYFARTGFKTAILGLSGGIDSALVATLAVQALGAKNVLGVAMPSQYSSSHSLEDAESLARALGIPFEVRPIKFLFSTASRELGEARGGQLAPLALENLQARLRGLTLMTFSNHYGALVLVTSNKSEMAVGYCTIYGDMCGALAPIGDVLKTRVYEVARHANQLWGNPIPERTFTKAPSAELRPDQTDQDTLPPYEWLDELVRDYIENLAPAAEIQKRLGAKVPGKPDWVKEVIRLIEMNEYRRRQAAPVLKVSPKAFGIGRRVPIAKRWSPF